MKKEITLAIVALVAVALVFAFVKFGEVDENMDKIAEKTVVIETSKGNIEISLDAANAPVTVANFLTYVSDGFYNGTIFHRVIPNFMAQGGGFTQDGVEKETHDAIILESKNGLKNKRGTIAMARTSVPNSATSQFFINIADNYFLDYAPGNDGYAVFGNVTKGMDVVDAIISVRTGDKGPYSDWPVEDIVIKNAYIKDA